MAAGHCSLSTAKGSICVLIAFLALWRPAQSLRFIVDRKECLQESVSAGDIVTGAFVVFDYDSPWRDEDASLDLEVKGPRGEVVYSVKYKEEDRFEFEAMHSGVYHFCFANRMTVPETVEISLHVGHVESHLEITHTGDGAKDEHVQEVIHYLESILAQTEAIHTDQDYFRARDIRRRQTTISINRRMLYYAALEVAVLIGASVTQVVILQRLFERRGGYR